MLTRLCEEFPKTAFLSSAGLSEPSTWMPQWQAYERLNQVRANVKHEFVHIASECILQSLVPLQHVEAASASQQRPLQTRGNHDARCGLMARGATRAMMPSGQRNPAAFS